MACAFSARDEYSSFSLGVKEDGIERGFLLVCHDTWFHGSKS